MTPAKWLKRHGFTRLTSTDECWDRKDASLIKGEGRWTCRYHSIPHEGLCIPGAIGFGKVPWIAMARCHNEQAWRLANPSLVRRSGRTTKMLRECLECLREGSKDITLVGATKWHAVSLKKQLEEHAEREGFSLSEVTIRTVSDKDVLRGCKTHLFEDHYATETFWDQRIRKIVGDRSKKCPCPSTTEPGVVTHIPDVDAFAWSS